jgi:hypothetical protein
VVLGSLPKVEVTAIMSNFGQSENVMIWFCYVDIPKTDDNGKEALKILGFKYPRIW